MLLPVGKGAEYENGVSVYIPKERYAVGMVSDGRGATRAILLLRQTACMSFLVTPFHLPPPLLTLGATAEHPWAPQQ